MSQSFYPEDEMLCFSAIINAYLYGLISYLDYKHYTKTYIAYHEITDEQFIEAYAKADAFFWSQRRSSINSEVFCQIRTVKMMKNGCACIKGLKTTAPTLISWGLWNNSS